jgi:hypothetical protein
MRIVGQGSGDVDLIDTAAIGSTYASKESTGSTSRRREDADGVRRRGDDAARRATVRGGRR